MTDQLPLFKSTHKLGLFRGDKVAYELRWFVGSECGLMYTEPPFVSSPDKQAVLAAARLMRTPVEDFTLERA